MSRLQKALRVAFVVMLVSSSVFSGTAVAAERGDCNTLDDMVLFLSLGTVNADKCSRGAYVNEAIEQMEQSDANQTKVDIYSAAISSQAAQETFSAPFDNYLNDTESVAWMKAEAAVAEAYANGSSKYDAKVAAREAISDYYTVKQVNLLEQWNVTASEVLRLRTMAASEGGIDEQFIYLTGENGENGGDTAYPEIRHNDPVSKNVALVNGSTHNVVAIELASTTGSGYHSDSGFATVASGNVTVPAYVAATGETIRVQAPDAGYNETTLLEFHEYGDRWERIEQKEDALRSEVDVFIDGTWADYESGEINASDVISTHTAMFEYGVRSGNESLWNTVAALSLGGFDVPDLNNSGTMTVSYAGSTYDGIVLARQAPNGSWQSGTTYHTSEFDGPVFMATTGGTKVDFAPNSSFTIDSMRDKNGNSLNETQTRKYAYKTANTSELLALQADLLELRQEIEDREPKGGGGGGGGSGSGSGSVPIIVVVALVGGVGALALANRQ